MSYGLQNWRMAFVSAALVTLATVGFVLAQNQATPPGEPAPPLGPLFLERYTPPEFTESAAEKEQPSAEARPRLSPAQEDIGALRKSFNLYAGKAWAQNGDQVQEQAAIARAVAAAEAEAAAEPTASRLPPPLEIKDELSIVSEQLRGLARNLDLLAANAEDDGDYERADRLRLAANRIRREVRAICPQVVRTPDSPYREVEPGEVHR